MQSKIISRPTKILISGTVAIIGALVSGVYTARAAAAQLARMEASPDCPAPGRSQGPAVLDVVAR